MICNRFALPFLLLAIGSAACARTASPDEHSDQVQSAVVAAPSGSSNRPPAAGVGDVHGDPSDAAGGVIFVPPIDAGNEVDARPPEIPDAASIPTDPVAAGCSLDPSSPGNCGTQTGLKEYVCPSTAHVRLGKCRPAGVMQPIGSQVFKLCCH